MTLLNNKPTIPVCAIGRETEAYIETYRLLEDCDVPRFCESLKGYVKVNLATLELLKQYKPTLCLNLAYYKTSEEGNNVYKYTAQLSSLHLCYNSKLYVQATAEVLDLEIIQILRVKDIYKQATSRYGTVSNTDINYLITKTGLVPQR